VIRLNLGSCDLPLEGFTNVDNSTSPHIKCDLVADALDLSAHFKPGTVDEITSSHLVEHLTPTEADAAFVHWKSLLKPGGKLSFITPDFKHLCQEYLDGGIPLDEMNDIYLYSYVQESLHKSMWDQETQFKMMSKHGFKDIKAINRMNDYRSIYGVEWQCGTEAIKP
jgi:predicted SAM-dependent methyltransferase